MSRARWRDSASIKAILSTKHTKTTVTRFFGYFFRNFRGHALTSEGDLQHHVSGVVAPGQFMDVEFVSALLVVGI